MLLQFYRKFKYRTEAEAGNSACSTRGILKTGSVRLLAGRERAGNLSFHLDQGQCQEQGVVTDGEGGGILIIKIIPMLILHFFILEIQTFYRIDYK